MIYIIDANNLAGKLNLLKEVDFDKQLIKIIEDYNHGKGKKIFLVFDGLDRYGDKYSSGNITIIRAPKDNFYKSADDKIIELAQNLIETIKDDLVVVTDDLGIKDLVVKNNLDNERKIKIIKATVFAEKLNFIQSKEQEDENDKKLTDREIEEINKEFSKVWQKD
jgi:predicted RNA-binding protein with PIN domain